MEIEMKFSKGVVDADNHYLATGHRIVEEVRMEKRWFYIDFIKRFRCCECDFTSMAGERKRF